MGTHPRLLTFALAMGVAVAGCGGDEPPASTPSPAATAPAPPAAKTAAAPSGTVPVTCIAKWTSGATGAVTCQPGGPDKDRVTVDKDTFRLDRICVNDPRVASFTAAGGNAVAIASKPEQRGHCAEFGGVQQLPESCTCVPPAGGDCTPPQGGFVCLAAGHVSP
jgi:hypothetical protein